MSYQHIYLSPHYDDAALSCGGTIHRQTQAGESVLVMTICSAPPPHTSFSPFAQEQHLKWGDPLDVVALRRAEDLAAMQILGVDYGWLDFVDCIYRGDASRNTWFYTSEAALFGEIHPAERSVYAQITETIIQQTNFADHAKIYAPLAVGSHIDHQLAHQTGRQLFKQGRDVVFYEDYPYVDPETPFGRLKLDETLARLAQQQQRFEPQLQLLSEDDLQAKIDSIKAYATQVGVLFGSPAETARRVRRYARRVGQGQPAERFWLPERGKTKE